uniref:FHA domain-containing protein n=1 Tax=Heterosigma akashiwo TaxID=2829 RepID=A0A7S4DEK1_HETAK|mmetsp:Transcript_15880/g.27963  ORF Transcript_15880/g.27963 Transcript_15880/m.27963 type:complete len:292 (-) Transcript_15880:141-1016(-)
MGEEQQQEPEAYAKLWAKSLKRKGKELVGYVQTLPTHVGRITEENKAIQDMVSIGETKEVSRHHLTIDWFPKRRCFSLTCKGKNGMSVNGMFYGRGGIAFINSRSIIRIGRQAVQFILPGENVDEDSYDTAQTALANPLGEDQEVEASNKTQSEAILKSQVPPPVDYADWVYEAMVCPRYKHLAHTTGVPAQQIITWILEQIPEFKNQECKKILSNGIHNVLGRKCIKVKDEDKGPKCFLWKMSPALLETRMKERHSSKKKKTNIRDSIRMSMASLDIKKTTAALLKKNNG